MIRLGQASGTPKQEGLSIVSFRRTEPLRSGGADAARGRRLPPKCSYNVPNGGVKDFRAVIRHRVRAAHAERAGGRRCDCV